LPITWKPANLLGEVLLVTQDPILNTTY